MDNLAEFIIDNFNDLNLGDDILRAITDAGYETPTSVQSSAIPLVLAGIDIIVQSQTGTGKTAAFAIPILEMLDKKARVEVLVLAPTRELAKQVCDEFERMGTHKGIHATAIYGGTAFEPQISALKTAQVVVATPGRLLDLLQKGHLTLDHLKFFILDEADEMMSMGFEKELDAVIEQLPERRQCLLFSATVTEAIKNLASHFLLSPEYIDLSSDSVAAEKVKHIYHMISGDDRLRDLVRLVEFTEPESALVFCNTRDDTKTVTRFLQRHGYKARVINGDLPQKEREKALQAVKDGSVRFLVATDVAARGIDISELPVVINYTLPEHSEVYIHRTGRTGRAGHHGIAYSLLSPREIGTYYQLIRVYKVALEEQPMPTRQDVIAAREARRLATLLETLNDAPQTRFYSPYLGLAERLLARADANERIARLLAMIGEPASKPASKPAADLPAQADPQQETPVAEAAHQPTAAPVDDVKPAPVKPEAPAEEPMAPEEQVEAQQPIAAEEASDDARPTTNDDEARTSSAQAPEEEDDGSARGRSRRRRRRSRPDEEEAPQQETPRQETRRPEPRRQETRRPEPPRQEAAAPEPQPKPEVAAPTNGGRSPASHRVVRLNIGRRELKADAIPTLICELAGLFPEDLGRVTIRDHHSLVEIRQDFAEDVIEAIDGQLTQGLTVRAELQLD